MPNNALEATCEDARASERTLYAIMIGRHSYIPLAIGPMIGPTVAYETAILDFPRSSITLRGFPLPWNGDAPLGSGPPTDIFVIPAIIDLVLYIAVCAIVWIKLYERLERARSAVRVPIVSFVWLYAAASVSLISLGVFGFGGSWMLWYETQYYESLLSVGLSAGV